MLNYKTINFYILVLIKLLLIITTTFIVFYSDRNTTFNLLEIGLGTNNPKIVSSMGLKGKPGASIRAFKEIYINASIYGADVDENILFKKIG